MGASTRCPLVGGQLSASLVFVAGWCSPVAVATVFGCGWSATMMVSMAWRSCFHCTPMVMRVASKQFGQHEWTMAALCRDR